jgi:hypothetical protein
VDRMGPPAGLMAVLATLCLGVKVVKEGLNGGRTREN